MNSKVSKVYENVNYIVDKGNDTKIYNSLYGYNLVKSVSCATLYTHNSQPMLVKNGQILSSDIIAFSVEFMYVVSTKDNHVIKFDLKTLLPVNIPDTIPRSQKISRISAGFNHVVLVTNQNTLYSFGAVKYGCLGCMEESAVDDENYILQYPRIVKKPKGEVEFLGCGYYFTVVVLKNVTECKVVVFGHADYVGTNNKKHQWLPTQLEYFDSLMNYENVQDNQCNKEKEKETGSEMETEEFRQGNYEDNSSKHGNNLKTYLTQQEQQRQQIQPRQQRSNNRHNNSITRNKIITKSSTSRAQVGALKLSVGLYHSCLLLDNHAAYFWGDNRHGQCGFPEGKTHLYSPEPLEYTHKFIDLCCGANHTILLDHKYDFYSFGYNTNDHVILDKSTSKTEKFNNHIMIYNYLGDDVDTILKDYHYSVEVNASADYTILHLNYNSQQIASKVQLFETHKENIEIQPDENLNNLSLYNQYFETKLKYRSAIRNIKNAISNLIQPFKTTREEEIKKVSADWKNEYLPKLYHYREKQKDKLSGMVRKGIPSFLRSEVWSRIIGNGCNVTKTIFEICKQKAIKARKYLEYKKSQEDLNESSAFMDNSNYDTGNTPMKNILVMNDSMFKNDSLEDYLIVFGKENTVKLIDMDLTRTFPILQFFDEEMPMNIQLRNVLEAYTFFRPDLGYVQGMSYIAGMLLLYMDQENAFQAFCNLINGKSIFPFYLFDLHQIEKRINIFKWCLTETSPGLAIFLEEKKFDFKKFVLEWFMTLFVKTLDLEVCARVWDVILVEGQLSMYRFGITLVRIVQDEIFDCEDAYEIYMVLSNLKGRINEDRLILIYEHTSLPITVVDEINKLEYEIDGYGGF